MSFVWTEDVVAKVADMLAAGSTSSQIAAEIQTTRQSVMSKVHRDPKLKAIGFKNPSGFQIGHKINQKRDRRAAPAKPKTFRQKRTSPRIEGFVVPAKKAEVKPVPTLAPDLEFRCEPVPMMEMTGCKWPVDGVDGVTLFCNEPPTQTAKSSYCEHHHIRSLASGKVLA